MHRRLLFRVASSPSVARLRPIQVAADMRARMYELENGCRVDRLTPTPNGVTVEITSADLPTAENLAAKLGETYPDVNITITWLEPVLDGAAT